MSTTPQRLLSVYIYWCLRDCYWYTCTGVSEIAIGIVCAGAEHGYVANCRRQNRVMSHSRLNKKTHYRNNTQIMVDWNAHWITKCRGWGVGSVGRSVGGGDGWWGCKITCLLTVTSLVSLQSFPFACCQNRHSADLMLFCCISLHFFHFVFLFFFFFFFFFWSLFVLFFIYFFFFLRGGVGGG